jgi:hypothetical protein
LKSYFNRYYYISGEMYHLQEKHMRRFSELTKLEYFTKFYVITTKKNKIMFHKSNHDMSQGQVIRIYFN